MDGLRNVVESFSHLLRRLHIELCCCELHAFFVFKGFPCLNTHENFLSSSIFPGHIVAVICSNKLNRVFFSKSDDFLVYVYLFRNSVFLDLQIKIIFNNFSELHRSLISTFVLASKKIVTNLTFKTGTRCNKPLRIFPQKFDISTWLVIKSFLVSFREKLTKVLITRKVFTKKNQVMNLVLTFNFILRVECLKVSWGPPIVTGARSEVNFRT